MRGWWISAVAASAVVAACALFPSFDDLRGGGGTRDAASEASSGDGGTDAAPSGEGGGGCASIGDAAVFASMQAPFDLETDTNALYWTNRETGGAGGVMKKTHDGATTIPIAANQPAPRGLFVSSTRVYWVNEGVPMGTGLQDQSGSVMSSTLDGQDLRMHAQYQSHPMDVVADDTTSTLYWTNYGTMPDPPEGGTPDGTVQSCKLSDCTSTAQAIASNEFGPRRIALANGTLYFSTSDSGASGYDGVIKFISGGNEGPTTTSHPRVESFVVDPAGPALVWTSHRPDLVYHPLGVGEDGVFSAGLLDVRGVAVDERNVYFVDNGTNQNMETDGAIYCFPKIGFRPDGGAPASLVKVRFTNPLTIATSAAAVYFADDQTIYRAAK